jgi:CubicO group peptidase (beta-lactamase class C family)
MPCHGRTTPLLIFLISASALAAAQQVLPRAVPETVGLSSAALGEGRALLERFVSEQKIAGAVAAVARHGQVALLHAVGVQDLDTQAPMTDRSIFRIYSMTKPVTAVAVMMLHEEGKFRLDDPVAMYLPEFGKVNVGGADGPPRPAVRAITVRDLLLHTSGLNHRTSDTYRREQVRSRAEPLPTLVHNMVRVPLMEDPGTRFRYSEATSVLGRLVEIWSGSPLDAFFDARIFGPLGMVDTGFVVGPEQRARLATVYAPAEGGGLKVVEIESVPFTERPALLEGAVGLVSTVPDFLRFSQMLVNKGALGGIRILRSETVEQITTNGLPESILKLRGGSMGWALANVNVVMDPASPLGGEYSWDGTAGTIFWIDPAREMITILMTQSAPSNPDGIRQKFKALVQQAILR